jgi:hypothetical protein
LSQCQFKRFREASPLISFHSFRAIEYAMPTPSFSLSCTRSCASHNKATNICEAVFDEVCFEYHVCTARVPVDVLLQKLSKDFRFEGVGNEEFYKRHGYSKKLLGPVKCFRK